MKLGSKILMINCYCATALMADPMQKMDQEAVQWTKEIKKAKEVDPSQFNWVEQLPNKVDSNGKNWIKEHLRNDAQIASLKQNAPDKDIALYGKKKCVTNAMGEDMDSPIYVLISFSVPDETWVNLSKELEKIGGVFILRGIPENSFKLLSQKILKLNGLGVMAPIQINPQLFTEYQVENVPTFIVRDEKKYDKISGNISVSYALRKMATDGDTFFAKETVKLMDGR